MIGIEQMQLDISGEQLQLQLFLCKTKNMVTSYNSLEKDKEKKNINRLLKHCFMKKISWLQSPYTTFFSY